MYYYHAIKTNLVGEPKSILVKSEEKVIKKDVVVIEQHEEFFCVIIREPVDKLDALAEENRNGVLARKIVCIVPIANYMEEKEKEYKRQVLEEKMQERLKEVQMKEKLQKYAKGDEALSQLLMEYDTI